MKRGPKPTVYLLLDINDVTNICGSMTTDELLKVLKIKRSQLVNWLAAKGILENKYVIVEDN